MKSNFAACLELVLKEEGGYVNNPNDPGGMTNLGVTKRAWESWVQKTVSENVMQKLTPADVEPFYKAQYWMGVKGDQLTLGLDYAVFDLAVNSGVSRAVKFLQKLAVVPADGVLGQRSLEAIAEADARQMIDGMCEMRMDFLKTLSTFKIFGKGWSERVERVRFRAMTMVEVKT